MNYWVVKGKPGLVEWGTWLRRGKTKHTRTKRPPKDASKGDRLFWWKSTPACRVVGLGQLVSVTEEPDSSGRHLIKVKHLTDEYSRPIPMEALRKVPGLGKASFLHSGHQATFYRLSQQDGELLYQLCTAASPHYKPWRDISSSSVSRSAWQRIRGFLDQGAA